MYKKIGCSEMYVPLEFENSLHLFNKETVFIKGITNSSFSDAFRLMSYVSSRSGIPLRSFNMVVCSAPFNGGQSFCFVFDCPDCSSVFSALRDFGCSPLLPLLPELEFVHPWVHCIWYACGMYAIPARDNFLSADPLSIRVYG